MVRTKNNRLIMQSKSSVCGIKKSRFVSATLLKEQEAKGLSNLGIRTPLSKIPMLNVLFWMQVFTSGRFIYARNAFQTARFYL